MIKRALCFFAIALSLPVTGAVAGPVDESFVRSTLNATFRSAAPGQSRSETQSMASVLSSSFDWRGIAEKVFQENWADLLPRQQDLAAATLLELSAREFAIGLDGSEQVTVTRSERQKAGHVIVSSTLVVPRRNDHEVRWLVVETQRGRRVLDVSLDGRSSVEVYRVLIAELSKEGFTDIEKMLARLRM